MLYGWETTITTIKNIQLLLGSQNITFKWANLAKVSFNYDSCVREVNQTLSLRKDCCLEAPLEGSVNIDH